MVELLWSVTPQEGYNYNSHKSYDALPVCILRHKFNTVQDVKNLFYFRIYLDWNIMTSRLYQN